MAAPITTTTSRAWTSSSRRLKAVISTGFGKLHFHETARALAAAGVEVNFLTGWVPKDNQTALVALVGGSPAEKHLARNWDADCVGRGGGDRHKTGAETPGYFARSCVWHGIPFGCAGQQEIF